MPYFRECPKCGAHLDPGESCDCENLEKEKKVGASEMKSIRLSWDVKKPKGRPSYPCQFK